MIVLTECIVIVRIIITNVVFFSGKLVQIEYALNAVKQGVTTIGIKCDNGVILATERKSNSSLIKNDTNTKVEYITPNIGMTYSGMGPD